VSVGVGDTSIQQPEGGKWKGRKRKEKKEKVDHFTSVVVQRNDHVFFTMISSGGELLRLEIGESLYNLSSSLQALRCRLLTNFSRHQKKEV
jgi:hypothetical protein